jgi:hypothetical protein
MYGGPLLFDFEILIAAGRGCVFTELGRVQASLILKRITAASYFF